MMNDLGLYASLKALPRMPLRRAFHAFREVLRRYWRERVLRGATGEVPSLRRLIQAGEQQAAGTFTISIVGEDVTRFVRSFKLVPMRIDAAFPVAHPRSGSNSFALGPMKLSEVPLPLLPAFAESVREAIAAEMSDKMTRTLDRDSLYCPGELLKEIEERMDAIRQRNVRRANLAMTWEASGGDYFGLFRRACRKATQAFAYATGTALIAGFEAARMVPDQGPAMFHPSAATLAAWLDRVTGEAEEISVARHLVACSRCRAWAEDVRWLESKKQAEDQS